MSPQLMSLHATSRHATSLQATASQATSDFAASAQPTASKLWDVGPGVDEPPVTNLSSPALGFGALLTRAAPSAFSSPTPSDPSVTPFGARAVSIRAPFTWSGVKFGCRARICAAAPATAGAENDVPESWM